MKKPSKEVFERAIEECLAADPDCFNKSYMDLTEAGQKAFQKNVAIIIGYIGPPSKQQLKDIAKRLWKTESKFRKLALN